MLLLTASIGAMLVGGVYGGVRAEQALADRAEVPRRVLAEPSDAAQPEPMDVGEPEPLDVGEPEPLAVELAQPEALTEPSPELLERPEELDALITAANSRDIVLEGGFRIGPFEMGTAPDETTADTADEAETNEASDEAPARARAATATRTTPRRVRHARRHPRPPPMPRLDPDPGRHTILVARRMMAQHEVIRGSCYRYLSEVFERAGHRGWRNRRIVYRAEREGPYANLDVIRPGDWLYIVNAPNSTPVGTHSVMFVGWQDRARGYARVISHPGWPVASAGRERGYDISRTYRIIRPVLPQ